LAEFRQFCGGRGIPGDWAGLLKMEEFFQFHEFKPGMLSKKARKCSAQRNLARQFCRVSLVHRMETKVARQPFEVIRLLLASISSLVVFCLRRFGVARKRNC
jgi:hypothetical protein